MAILIANLTYSPFLLKQFAKPKSLPSLGALVRWWSRGGVEGASSPTAANSDQVIANKSYDFILLTTNLSKLLPGP